MKEHFPKQDLWGKIQQRKDFDSQVEEHVLKLPLKIPNADLWASIERKLDQKAPVSPLWKYGMVAASFAMLMALSGIIYFQFRANDPVTELISVNHQLDPTSSSTFEKIAPKTEQTLVISEETKTKETKNIPSKKQSIERETTVPIELPNRSLADLGFKLTFKSELIIPPLPEREPTKTLHQVSISWSKLKPGIQLKTPYGRQYSELGQTASTDKIGQVTLEIKN